MLESTRRGTSGAYVAVLAPLLRELRGQNGGNGGGERRGGAHEQERGANSLPTVPRPDACSCALGQLKATHSV